jgi:hypothetical protein
MMRTATIHIALLILGIVAVGMHSSLFGELWYAYNPDSAAYIDAARNVLAGRGLVITPGLMIADRETVPFTLWPPGYSSLIAGLSALTGLPPKLSALWIARGAAALIPAALAFSLRPLLGLPMSAAIGVLCLLSPFALEHGFLAMSDLPLLLLVVLSFGLLIRAWEGKAAVGGLLLSGLLAGLAYSVRNAALAWIAAVLVAFILAAPLQLCPWRTVLRRGLFWLTGLLVVLIPMWVRNLLLTGSLGTYEAPPAGGDPVSLSRGFLAFLLKDFSGSAQVGLLAWDAKWFAVLVIPLLLLAAIFLVRRWLRMESADRFGLLLLLLYLGAGSAMVVIAAVKWLGGIDPRMVIQYSWILLALGAAALAPAPGLPWGRWRLGFALTILIALLASRMLFHFEVLARERHIAGILDAHPDLDQVVGSLPDESWVLRMQLARLHAADEGVAKIVTELPSETLAVSNMGYIYRIGNRRPVRSIYLKYYDGPEALREALGEARSVHKGRPIWFGFMASNQMLKSADGSWRASVLAGLPEDCSVSGQEQYYVAASCPAVGSEKP